jgi:drug/metabolite transporter (DMT)-like permease
MKRGMDAFTSDQVAAMRIFMAFLFLLPLAFRHIKRELLQHSLGAAGMGVFGNFIPAFLFTKAETMISSALTGMLNSLTPVFTLLLGLAIFRQKVRWMQVLGVIIGLGGAVGLLALGNHDGKETNGTQQQLLLGGALVVLATFFYGLSVNIIKAKLSKVNAITASVFAMCIIGPVAGAYLFSTDFVARLQNHPHGWSSLGYVAILAILGTSISVIVYNILIREAGTLFAASVTYLMPIIAMGWGLRDHETVTLLHLVFILIILGGVWMVNKK